MIIEGIQKRHIKEILDIAFDGYKSECGTVDFLPAFDEVKENIEKSVIDMIDSCEGYCLSENEVVRGYLLSYDVKNLFGNEDGSYIPLHGHGAIGDNKSEIYNKLYAHFSENSVKKGLTSHAITLYAQDAETVNNFFWLGFGLRCIDSITEIKHLSLSNNMVVIKKADVGDLDSISELYVNYEDYFTTSPLFMFREREDIEDLKKWLMDGNKHLWIAYLHAKPVGFMQIEDNGESFISEHSDVMNITGAFVDSEQRSNGIANSLLIRVFSWMKENNYTLCGVDFESFNVSGSRFWNKFFEPYTYSVVRRIDERIKME